VALVVVVVVLLFLVLNWYVAPTQPGERKDLVLAVAQILGGTALISGLYFTWRTLQVNSEGQITERFTRAIDQLGKFDDERKKLFEIRLGGIYALERIARESPEDYWPIMEILTAYVRHNAPWASESLEEGLEGMDDATEGQSAMESSGGRSEPIEAPAPDLDIQAIMTVLGRRPRSYLHGESEVLDLHETNLSGANLSGANLSNPNFLETNLSGADLSRTKFSEAVLVYSDLSRANLSGAKLSGVHSLDTDFSEALFIRADLSGANLSGANLSGTLFSDADLFSRVDPQIAAQIELTILQATIEEEVLSDTNLSGADLSQARHLTQEQLEATTGDGNTQIPSHLKPPAHWGVKTDEQIDEQIDGG
jgi:hypothetical protein